MSRLLHYLRHFFTRCHSCRKRGAERYRQRTSYTREEANWKTLCPECRAENDAYWDERWAEYYSDKL